MTTQTQVRSTEEALSIEDTSARSALKMALELIQDYVDDYGPHDKDSGAQYTLTAIKEALAQLASYTQEPVGFAVMQKPWAGLTYEEQEEIVSNSHSIRDCITKTTEKLKEKNT